MEKYAYLEHLADVLYEAYGSSFEEALENAAEAMFNVISDIARIEEQKSYAVDEKASSMPELVSFLLGDIVSLSDSQEYFFKRIKAEKLEVLPNGEGYRIKCAAFGEPYSAEKGLEHVKAVTHHDTIVDEKNGAWRIRVLLDI